MQFWHPLRRKIGLHRKQLLRMLNDRSSVRVRLRQMMAYSSVGRAVKSLLSILTFNFSTFFRTRLRKEDLLRLKHDLWGFDSLCPNLVGVCYWMHGSFVFLLLTFSSDLGLWWNLVYTADFFKCFHLSRTFLKIC